MEICNYINTHINRYKVYVNKHIQTYKIRGHYENLKVT